MQVTHHLAPNFVSADTRTIITIGSYDGVHRGHKQILQHLQQSADQKQALSTLITFHPHPKVALNPQSDFEYLTTVDEKKMLLAQLGVAVVVILPFSREFAQTTAREFMQTVVNSLHPVELWSGPDFKFGKGRTGDVHYLQELGQELDFEMKVLEFETAEASKVSSTRVREALQPGDIQTATNLLGHYPFLHGLVVEGDRRGRTIGFPTANVAVDAKKLLPRNGVYAVWLDWAGTRYPGVANIGVRPTFEGATRTVEVHLFDFDQDIYQQAVTVHLADFIRSERKFDGLEALVAQITADVETARSLLRQKEPPAWVMTQLPHPR